MRRITFALVVLVALPAVAAAQGKGEKPKAAPAVVTPVNINTATAAQLEALPGIGARTAQLIIEHRQKNGGFKKIEELMNIKGIGEKSFLKLKPMITAGPEKTDKADKADKAGSQQ
jgi:competence protein ComEA